jgi:hypothetical protein
MDLRIRQILPFMDIHEDLCSSIALLEYLQARGYLTTLDTANIDLKSCSFLQIIHLCQLIERNLGLIQLTEEQSGIKSFYIAQTLPKTIWLLSSSHTTFFPLIST